MPLHNASRQDDLPQYENPHKQEAVRFLAADIEEQQLIDGMEDVDRVDAWLQVVDRFEDKDGVADALRNRRALLLDELDQQATFEPASQTKSGQQALADGGAEAIEHVDCEPDADQDVMQYADPAERESQFRDACQLARTFETVEQVREKIRDEYDRDVRRPHVVDALEKRLKEVASE